jgi:hypothetical protein
MPRMMPTAQVKANPRPMSPRMMAKTVHQPKVSQFIMVYPSGLWVSVVLRAVMPCACAQDHASVGGCYTLVSASGSVVHGYGPVMPHASACVPPGPRSIEYQWCFPISWCGDEHCHVILDADSIFADSSREHVFMA